MALPFLPQPLGRLPGEPPSWDDGRSWDGGWVRCQPPEHAYPRTPTRPRLPEHPRRSEVFGLPGAPASVGQARENVREALDAWGAGRELCDDTVLLVSELVTNALAHTGSDRVVCRLSLDGGRLRVEVEDQNRSGTLPQRRQPDTDDQNGRGLMLVGALSSDWGAGASSHGSGSVVWAELAWRSAEPLQGAVRSPAREAGSPGWESASPSAATATVPKGHRPARTSSHVTRPVPRSAEGHLSHGTPAHP